MPTIHPSAIVTNGAEIGENCTVGPYTYIGPNVKIGRNCQIKSHVVIDGFTELGNDNVVYQFASVGADPQDRKWRGEPTKVVIGSGNVIREYVTIQPGLEQFGGVTSIGNGNLLMACSHVAHDVTVGDNNWLTNSAALGGHVQVGSHVIFGGLSGVHQFCRIGDHAFISAGSMVAQDVPPYCLVQGDRARLRTINRTGLRRAGLKDADILEINRIFKALFVSSNRAEDRIAAVEAGYAGSVYAYELLRFVRATKRGIVGYRTRGSHA